MSETPLPQPLYEEPDDGAGPPDSRPRRRPSAASSRPVSAFAPAHSSARSEPSSQGQLTQEDCSFVSLLHEAAIASELDGGELTRTARLISHELKPARRIDMLDAYYDAAGDPIAGQRRTATDRWFVYRSDDSLDAQALVNRLLAVLPELAGARFERVGGSDGALVLRAGDHVCAIEDDADDDGTGSMSVSVRDVVRAVNVLLDRHGVRVRMVGLIGDGAREAYVGVGSLAAAVALVEGDCLAATDTESLMQLVAW
jgi:hypothetical protein